MPIVVLLCAGVRCRHDAGESARRGDDATHKLSALLELGRCTRRSTDVCAKCHTTLGPSVTASAPTPCPDGVSEPLPTASTSLAVRTSAASAGCCTAALRPHVHAPSLPSQGRCWVPSVFRAEFAGLVDAALPEFVRTTGHPHRRTSARGGETGSRFRRHGRCNSQRKATCSGTCAPTAAWVLPHANTNAMNLHLVEIGRHVASGAHAVVILDGAGWHRTDGRLRSSNHASV